MTTYTFYIMNEKDYNNYMQGSHNYTKTQYEVMAETKEEALVKARISNPGMIILHMATISTEVEKTLHEIEQKKADAKAKRKEKENQPGYKAARNYRRKVSEIEKMKAEIERLQKEIEKAEYKKAEYAAIYFEETGKKI